VDGFCTVNLLRGELAQFDELHRPCLEAATKAGGLKLMIDPQVWGAFVTCACSSALRGISARPSRPRDFHLKAATGSLGKGQPPPLRQATTIIGSRNASCCLTAIWIHIAGNIERSRYFERRPVCGKKHARVANLAVYIGLSAPSLSSEMR